MNEYYVIDRRLVDIDGNRLPESRKPSFFFGAKSELKFNLSCVSSITKLLLVCDTVTDCNGLVFMADSTYDKQDGSVTFKVLTKTEKFYLSVSENSPVIAKFQILGYDKNNFMVDVLLDDQCLLYSVAGSSEDIVIPFDHSKLESNIMKYSDSAFTSSVIANESAEEAKRAEISCLLIKESMENKLREMK